MRNLSVPPRARDTLRRLVFVALVLASREGDLERGFGQGNVWAFLAIVCALLVVAIGHNR